LTAKDFFGIADKEVSELNLIDRINLFFKKQKVDFSEEEMVWVKRVAKTKTPDDVLNLSEELYAWMAENAPEEGGDDEKTMIDPNGKSGEGEEGETGEGDGSAGDDGEETGGGDAPTDDKGDENGNDAPTGGTDDVPNDGDDANPETETGETTEEGGVESTGRGGPPKAETDTDANNAGEMLVDKNAAVRTYGRIPALKENLIIPFSVIVERANCSL